MTYFKSANTYIRGLYSPGFSSLTMSLYRTNLTLSFAPYEGKDNNGLNKYSKERFLSTSINYEGAAFLSLVIMHILDGKDTDKSINAVLPCNKNTSLTFEYKPEFNNRMSALLTINKNNVSIPFKFSTCECRQEVNGQLITKTIQSGLGVLYKALDGYLTSIGADRHLSKLSDEDLVDLQ